MNKIKTIIRNPIWSFFGVVLTIIFNLREFTTTHTNIQYFLAAIALLLMVHGLYRLWKQKKLPEYDILDDCVLEEDPDWFRNPITDEKFCSDCWDAYKIKRRLKKDWGNWPIPRWICPSCNKSHTSLKRALINSFMKSSDADKIIHQFENSNKNTEKQNT